MNSLPLKSMVALTWGKITLAIYTTTVKNRRLVFHHSAKFSREALTQYSETGISNVPGAAEYFKCEAINMN